MELLAIVLICIYAPWWVSVGLLVLFMIAAANYTPPPTIEEINRRKAEEML